MKKTLLVLLCLVLITLVMFTGCKKEEENKILRLMSWSGYAPQSQIDAFEEETGIKVEVTLSSNEEMISKLRATGGGGFDLAQPSQDRVSSVVEQFGIYQPIDYSKVDVAQIEPNMLAATKKYTEVDGESYAVPHVFGTSGLIVNKKYAGGANNFIDLLDTKYTGRVSYRAKRPTIIAIAFALGKDPFALYNDKAAYQELLDEVGAALIKGKPVVKNYWENGDALLESMRSEEVWLAMGWEQGAWKLYKENPNIDYVAPVTGALAWVDTFALPAKSENVEAAYKWINYVLKPENAAGFTNAEGYGTASLGASKFYEPEAKANFERCFTPEAMANMKWYPTVPPGLEEMEGKMLDKVRAAK